MLAMRSVTRNAMRSRDERATASGAIQKTLISVPALIVLCAAMLLGCEVAEMTFTVRIENISADSALPSALAPGLFAVHDQTFALFIEGEEHDGLGLEALAEDGNPFPLGEYLNTASGVFEAGVFASPFQDGNRSPLLPGEGAYAFTFSAHSEAQYLSFATMLVESNDLFFALDDGGIKLFRFGAPINGDITQRVLLWDAFTEINETPGEGAYQAPRQLNINSGPSETGPVSVVNDQFDYPAVNELIRVIITPIEE